MKSIGLISDTHSYLDPKVLDHFNDCDEIWHAGDIGDIQVADQLEAAKKFKAVHGNIDGGKVKITYPEHHFFVCEGFSIWLTHIAGRPGAYARGIKEQLNKRKPDILICGHSHILRVQRDEKFNKMLYINPGAAGKHGFHKVRTLIKFKLDKGKIFDMNAIELGLRASLDPSENQFYE